MSGELFTPAQKSAINADRPVVAGDLLVVAEYAAKGLTSAREEAASLRKDVERLKGALAEQFKFSQELLAVIKVVARQPAQVDEAKLAELTKAEFFKNENTMMRAFASLSQQMRAIENSALMEWKGPHRADEQYYKGDVTQRDGRSWVALTDNKGEAPGRGSTAWRSFAIAKESP